MARRRKPREAGFKARVAVDAVVAVDQGGGIGRGDGLPWPKLKGDLAYFKRITSSAALMAKSVAWIFSRPGEGL